MIMVGEKEGINFTSTSHMLLFTGICVMSAHIAMMLRAGVPKASDCFKSN